MPAPSAGEDAFSRATATRMLMKSVGTELAWDGRARNPQPDTIPLPMEDSVRANTSCPILWLEGTHFLEHPRNCQPPSGFQGQMISIHPFLWRATSLTLASSWMVSLHVSRGQVWCLLTAISSVSSCFSCLPCKRPTFQQAQEKQC